MEEFMFDNPLTIDILFFILFFIAYGISMLLMVRHIRDLGVVAINVNLIIAGLYSVSVFYDKVDVTINGITYGGKIVFAVVALFTYGLCIFSSRGYMNVKKIKKSDYLKSDVIYNNVIYVVSVLAYAIYDIAGYVCLLIAFIHSIMVWKNRRGKCVQDEYP
ncbi:MAG: hypothetical protein KAR06_10365 [Deltaproteobacteria bacterium]|nr:hypothetical protein [Deltaproteobacteria bacterium]